MYRYGYGYVRPFRPRPFGFYGPGPLVGGLLGGLVGSTLFNPYLYRPPFYGPYPFYPPFGGGFFW